MTTTEETETEEIVEEEIEKKPLWLEIEDKFLGLSESELSGQDKEATIQKIAGDLDNDGFNVSKRGGNLLQLRWAMDDMLNVGRPMMKDFNDAIGALTLDDVTDPFATTTRIIDNLGQTWGELKKADRRPTIIGIIEDTRLNLLVKKAQELDENASIRYLIGETIARETIIEKLEITEETLKEVEDQIAAEKAERKRVFNLLGAVAEKSEVEKVKHLITNEVTEELIIELAQVESSAIDEAKKAMEEELKEQQRLAEEEAARKKAEAEGPSLDSISSDDMIDFIDSIREIMEFSDVEQEIRTMCDQSAIPKALVDIAVSDPDKLDELEKEAEG